jgi:rRNA maturation protein Nop10
MAVKKCPICGEMTLLEKHGEYRMALPANIPGGSVVVPDSAWQHCESCGEDILSAELEQAIDTSCRGKRVARVG